MANEFLNVVNDKFTNKTTTEMSYGYNIWSHSSNERNLSEYHNPFIHDCPMQMRLRHVSTPNLDDLVLDLDYSVPSFGGTWFFLYKGELIININNVENIRLKPHENYSKVDSGTVSESVFYYGLNKELLKKICEARTLDFKIVGESEAVEVNENGFIKYAQVFYNGFYDSTQYVESLEIPRSYLRDKEKQEKSDKILTIGCYIVLLIIFVAVVLFFL